MYLFKGILIIWLMNKKVKRNKKISKETLEDKIKKYKGPNLAKDFTWDEPIGKEKLEK